MFGVDVGGGGRVGPREAIAGLRAALDVVGGADWGVLDAPVVPLVIGELETQLRRLEAVSSDLVAVIDRGGLHRLDGHASGKVMVRHCAQLSGVEASARDGAAKVMGALPELALAYRAGRVGTPQVRRLGRAWRNPRVREQMAMFEATFLRHAQQMEYLDFDAVLTQWERLADADGAEPPALGRRSVRMVQNPDLGWTLTARFGCRGPGQRDRRSFRGGRAACGCGGGQSRARRAFP